LVRSTPIGAIPVWCNNITAACSVSAPSSPSEIGKYIFTLRSYDTTTLLYSDDFVYDTIIIKPSLPIVVNKKYIIGNKTNPTNISVQVTGLPASTIKYFKNALLLSSIPTLGNTFGLTRYTASQVINNIESDTIGFTVTMLDPKTLFHLQKIASEPRLLANSSFTIIYRFLLNNRTDEAMSNILMEDNLQNTFTYPTLFDVVSISSTGGLIYNNTFNGKTDIQLLKSTSSLAPNSTDTINLTLNLQPKGYAGVLNNIALLTATTPYGSFSMNSSSSVFANEIVKTSTPLMVPDLKIDIPEAFSPNRDGVNDRFVIVKPFGTTLELEVFNRWGIMVYYNTNYNNEWDGRGINNFIGQDLMDGGYYYTLKTKSPNGSSQIFKGFVLIQR
jgi:gliding motility-associated-like protein